MSAQWRYDKLVNLLTFMVSCLLTFSHSLFPCQNVMFEISKLIFFTNYNSKH